METIDAILNTIPDDPLAFAVLILIIGTLGLLSFVAVLCKAARRGDDIWDKVKIDKYGEPLE